MRTPYIFLTSLLSIVIIALSTHNSYAVPTTPPSGGYTGGLFSVYFKNIVEGTGDLTSYNTLDNGSCPTGQGIVGFYTGSNVSYGTPICGQISSPQYWTSRDAGTNIYFTGAGNVGIGTSIPSAKLDVSGDAKINGITVGRGSENIPTNTANGNNTLYSNTTGSANTANGASALYRNTTGSANTANGIQALYSNTTGYSNTANGASALYSNTTGNNNTSLGYQAGFNLTSGNNNIFLGANTQPNISNTGSNQLNIGNWIYGQNGNIGIGASTPTTRLTNVPLSDVSSNPSDGSNYNMKSGGDGRSFLWKATGGFAGVFVNDGTSVLSQGLMVRISGTGSQKIMSAGVGVGAISNTDRFVVLGNGNVGIGTPNPSTTLDINGQVRITGGAPGAGKVLTSDATGLASWGIAPMPCTASGTGFGNTCYGNVTLQNNTTGYNNTANGYYALFSNTTGYSNTANGIYALRYNTTGSNNTANGVSALYSNTTGYSNTANGVSALYSNTTGYSNTANGNWALRSNTTGNYNTANGIQALYSNTTGYSNTANGYQALYVNTTGGFNTANGYQALYSNTTGSANTANGIQALYSNTTGYNNTANGVSALYSNTTGNFNTANGHYALYFNTTGNQNTALGYSAGSNLTSGDNNIFLGYNVQPNISNTGSNQLNIGNWIYGNNGNIGIGILNPTAKLEVAGQVKITGGSPGVGKVLTSDASGLASWGTAGYPCTPTGNTGAYNTCYGVNVLQNNTTGNGNTANGYRALSFNTTGNSNTANGVNALLYNTTGNYNTANGVNALRGNTTGNGNTANGIEALVNNTTGIWNIANGYNSLYSNTTGNVNTANGALALYSNTIGSYNTSLGYQAGANLTSGDNNIFLGYNTQPNISNTASNQLNIGNWIYGNNGNIGIGVASPAQKLDVAGNINATGYFYSSDKNLKKNIIKLNDSLEKISSLNGYNFEWKASNRQDIGIIAQEVELVFPELVSTNTVTGYKSVEYGNLVAPLIESIKQLANMHDEQEKKIQSQETQLVELKKQNEILLKRLEILEKKGK